MTRNRPIDPALLRGLTMPRISRRDALRGAGLLGASAFLAACGVEGSGGDEAPQESGFWASQTLAKQLNFANWPLYMDQEKQGGKTVYPSLQAGQDTGWDLIVITNGGPIEKLIRQNFLIELDHSKLPTFAANAAPSAKNPSYDPGNKFTVPWQSGLVGLAYNPKLTKREITSWQDLKDPAFKGKITMFGDDTDFPTSVMIMLGIDPAKSTEEDWKRAADEAEKLRPQLREFVDNSGMVDAMSSGNAWISQAYSGDVYQLNNSGSPDIKFVIPEEGATYWTDNMAIPKGAKHPLDAITYMDYVYRPEVAATLTAYITYITPVPAAKEELQAEAAKLTGEDKAYYEDLVTNPLVFPSEADLAKTKRYRTLTVEEEQVWDGIFQPIVQS